MKKILLAGIASATMIAAPASAAVIGGGETTITILFDVADNNIDASALGDAMVEFGFDDQPVYQLNMSGGEIFGDVGDDFLTGSIAHSGGMRFSRDEDFIEVTDLNLDLTNGALFADFEASNGTSGNDAGVFQLFTVQPFITLTGDPFDDADDQAFTLALTETAATLFSSVFGSDIGAAAGGPYASVEIDPEPVPVPGAALLFAPAAFVGLRMARRKGKDRA